jgi:hypothetical protein
MKKTKNTTTQDSATTSLTKTEIVRAALNDSTLSRDTFQLGDKTFPIKDLTYDQYTKFLILLSPLADSLISKAVGSSTQLPGLEGDVDISMFNISDMIRLCGESLPDLALICVHASEPTMTLSQVKELGKTPFALAHIVIAQMARNNMLKDFADFFAQLLPKTK